MPRTAVTPVAFVPNGSLDDNVGTTIDAALVTNGVRIPNAVPEETVIRVRNTFAGTKVVTIGAGDSPPALAAGQGAITGTVAASTGERWFGPFESGRFSQNNGDLEVDFAAGTTGTITVYRMPRTA